MTLLLALIGGVIGVWMVRRRRSAWESTDGLSIAVAGVKAAEDEDDFAWLRTPCDVGHPAAWDRYWEGQLAHGNVASAFGDMMSSNRELPGLLRRRGVRRVLCAGSGLWRPGLSKEHFAQRWALKGGFSHNDEAERAVMLQVTTG
jgi:hypothetical protein